MCMSDDKKKGVILKGIGGFYYVLADGKEYETRARGLFRKDGIKPVPGDRVVITLPTDVSGGYLEDILERKNQLIRPMVANMDRLMIVVSAKAPQADLLLVDKLLIYAAYNKLPAVLVINKCDESLSTANEIASQYKGIVETVIVSAKTGEGLDSFKALLRGKTTCFAGQSAVGKSSLLNAVCSRLELETGGLSKKTARGKHTTRHSELIYIPELDAMVTDTPGFSILELMDLEPEQLKDFYPEFKGADCRFAGKCLHYKEPECGVIERLKNKEISEHRYKRYLELLEYLKQRKERKYD